MNIEDFDNLLPDDNIQDGYSWNEGECISISYTCETLKYPQKKSLPNGVESWRSALPKVLPPPPRFPADFKVK